VGRGNPRKFAVLELLAEVTRDGVAAALLQPT
jgi:hypothetical protein